MRWSAAGLVCILAVTACAGPATAPSGIRSRPPGTGSAPHSSDAHSLDEQEKARRRHAEDEARRLLGLAQIPPGAVALGSAPAPLSAPAMGEDGVESVASLTGYWRLPLSFPAAERYVAEHPPAGLTQWASSSESSPTAMVHGYGWADTGSASHGELEAGLAPIGDAAAAGGASFLRVDARVEWLDPHPMPDSRPGPRMRLDAGNRCPADDRGLVGVRNPGPDFDRNLVPPGTPTAGLVCSYAGLNGKRFGLLLQRVLPAGDAARLAGFARRVDLGHLNGGRAHCPMHDGSVTVLMLQYPHRAAANLWLDVRGCSSASNGHVRAPGSATLAALMQAVNGLTD